MKKCILFLCTGNSCRSQMAEGWARHLHGGSFDIYSAGIQKHGMNPLAVRVMAEAGVDISEQQSKLIDELPVKDFDLVITVCANAHESCPVFSGKAKIVHHGFDDPPKLAQTAQSEDEAITHYRRVRNEIRDYIKDLHELI
ncbi:MAG: arsenate reductase ArsC [Proteobacteria bacterium]|nr:arsenate reductase ArsC [Pseudomonadota bacterium]MBU1708957.1 arsenate reductase ArsC [Pseudomonadota bacterium]